MATERRDDHKPSPGEATIPIVEEVAHLSKRTEVTGRVRVSTKVDEIEEVVRGALRTDHVEVTRVPVNRPVDTVPAIRTEGDVTIVPVLEEVLVVEKRLVLKEELHIRRSTTTETVEEPVKLRRQRAVVERIEGDAEGPAD